MKEYVSGPDARDILKCDKETLNAILKEGKIESFRREDGAWQIKRADLVRYAEENASDIRSFVLRARFREERLIDNPIKYFKSHFSTLYATAHCYVGLKKAAEKGLVNRSDFQNNFSSFYGMIGVYVTPEFKEKYFARLKQILDDGEELTLDTLTMDADNIRSDRKIEYSFITKMYNLVDDTRFPIYDKNVLSALKIKAASKNLDLYKENYLAIISAYESSRDVWEPVVKTFREYFDLEGCKYISDLRILDVLIWCIGGRK